MKISVFGTGYVGLVTGTCFAEMGNEVICADVNEQKIQALLRGVSPIYEPGLDALIASNVAQHRLSFTTDLKAATVNSDLLFIAVGTPPHEDGSADLQYVLQVADTIGKHLETYKVIVNKSTVPIGTAQKVKETIWKALQATGQDLPFDVVSNPEFLKEGTAIEDCMKPSRVVVGCESDRARKQMEKLYEPFLRNGNPFLCMNWCSAEMTKYAANAMLATKISFMNELSRMCECTGADIEFVRQGIGSDPRIGYSFIYPGLGYGGSCFPKDVQALIQMGKERGETLEILQAVENVNQLQRLRFFKKIEHYFQGALKGKKIALWGLAFKPGTDDLREAPALDLIHRLVAGGAEVAAYDPVAMPAARSLLQMYPQVSFQEGMYLALAGADALVVATEWKPFREPHFQRMKTYLKSPVIFDGRNIYNPGQLREQGFIYVSVGRSSVH